ncbi:MAG: 1-(5-phosphoribosyl)-5-[(5-phosphoribosylamino)methylideneamino]imidazole-4-carboxamide isomerase [Dehalococcoidia bacterium]
MEVIPAIDIRGGRCVRLYQGDYARETVFSDDPVAVARRWAAEGAPRLHLVDLDGARQGRPVNQRVIADIIRDVSVPVQVGGGVRDMAAIEELLAAGADRAILGTTAVREPDLVREACARYGERIVVSVDAREGLAATEAWRETSEMRAEDLMHAMVELGVRRFVYTDIARDGTMTEPNFAAYRSAVKAVEAAIIASGGVASLEHLRRLASIGVEGAIVGRAVYDGRVGLREALDAG